MKKHLLLIVVLWVSLLLITGCGTISVQTSTKPFSSEEAQQFSSIKKIAILPFDNLTKQKDAEKLLSALMTTRLLNEGVFESVEDVRYVASVMKMLKIKRTEILDRDLVLKMGETMRAEAIILGQIDAYVIGKSDESTDISISATMLDTRSGDILWTANVTKSSSTSVGKVFGVTPGPNHLAMLSDVVEELVDALSDGVRKIREEEMAMEVDRRLLEEEPGDSEMMDEEYDEFEDEIPEPMEAEDEPELEIED